MNTDRRTVAGVALALGAMTFLASDLAAQKASPAELAAKLSGTWTMNRELSPGFSGQGGPRGRRGGGNPSLAFAGMAGQRRGSVPGGDGPNGPSDLTSEEMAAQVAIRQLQ